MNMDWNDLKVFLAVERGGSARAAAVALSISHSTVLRRLQTLETALGTVLFDRTPDGLMLSASGARVLAKAQQIEAEVLEVERDVRGADIRLQGQIRLTVPPPIIRHLLLPHLTAFRADYPDIDLEVVSTYDFSDLGRRDADVAIRFAASPDDHLVGRRLPVFRDAIYASPDYLAGLKGTGGQGLPAWIGWPNVTQFTRRVAKTPFAANPVSWRLAGLELQAEAARQSLGMALLPCIMGDADAALVRMPNSATYDTLPAWLLTHPDLRRMERVRVFAQFLHGAIAKRQRFVGGRQVAG
jgi:DNA-binding transcriptional LysR family regulator